jgi:hypothetical protein
VEAIELWERGELVELDGLLAAVVGTDREDWVPEDHVALWFGDPQGVRKSQGGPGGLIPEVWTVPAEYCSAARAPDVCH